MSYNARMFYELAKFAGAGDDDDDVDMWGDLSFELYSPSDYPDLPESFWAELEEIVPDQAS